MKNRVPLIVALGIGLIAGFYMVALKPYLAQKTELWQQLSQSKAELADFNQTLSQMPSVVETRKQLQRQLDELNSHLYAKAELVSLFDELKGRARASHLELLEISPPVAELLALNRQAVDSVSPQFLNLSVGLKGEYLEFGQFMTDLENAPYFRGVTACYLSDPVGSPRELQIVVEFRAMLGLTQEASS
jgi:Tfp pilus assembly protein PilO